MSDAIIDRGRGPELSGTRITVYDIWDYAKHGWHEAQIAAELRLSSRQIRAALHYIEANRDEVLAAYQEMLDRDARGNPPELQKKLDTIHEKYQKFTIEKRKQAGGEVVGERASG